MNSKQFSLEIEKYKKDHPVVTYMDSIINYCEERGIDTSAVVFSEQSTKREDYYGVSKVKLVTKTSEEFYLYNVWRI